MLASELPAVCSCRTAHVSAQACPGNDELACIASRQSICWVIWTVLGTVNQCLSPHPAAAAFHDPARCRACSTRPTHPRPSPSVQRCCHYAVQTRSSCPTHGRQAQPNTRPRQATQPHAQLTACRARSSRPSSTTARTGAAQTRCWGLRPKREGSPARGGVQGWGSRLAPPWGP